MLSPRLRLATTRWVLTTHPYLVLAWVAPAALIAAGQLLGDPHLGRWGLFAALLALLASCVRIGIWVTQCCHQLSDGLVGRMTEIVAYWEEDVVRRHDSDRELRIVPAPRDKVAP